MHRVGGRADRQLVETRVAPSLLDAIQRGGSNDFMRGALLAIAKIGGERNRAKFDFVLNWFLSRENSNAEMNHVAPIALGVLATPANYRVLADLALDNERGREAHGGGEVDEAMRAFATYGLGMIGARSTDLAFRSQVVADLVGLLEDEDHATNEVRVAAMVSLGLVPLEVVEDVVVCYCGTCQVADPHSSLQAQVTYLLRYFNAERDYDPVVRAHTATTLGRLIEAHPPGMTLRLKEVVADFLIDSLAKHARQPAVVKQSAVLALGQIGDADGDKVDQWIRWSLGRAASSGGPIERRFALMSLAQIAARGGQDGESAWSGTGDIRARLLHNLTRARKDVKPWAGLALGVMGYHLSEAGQPTDPGVDAALRRAASQAKTADTLGAYALASGLRGDRQAAAPLLKRLHKVKDEAAVSYAALGLALMGAREAIEPLQEAMQQADSKPLLASRAGLALGLLGEGTIVDDLLAILNSTRSEETRAAAARALGYIGDKRGVEALLALIVDEDASEEAREAAVVALGFASDPAALPWRTALTRGANYLARTSSLTDARGGGVLDLE